MLCNSRDSFPIGRGACCVWREDGRLHPAPVPVTPLQCPVFPAVQKCSWPSARHILAPCSVSSPSTTCQCFKHHLMTLVRVNSFTGDFSVWSGILLKAEPFLAKGAYLVILTCSSYWKVRRSLNLCLWVTSFPQMVKMKGLFAFSFVTTIMRFLDISVF